MVQVAGGDPQQRRPSWGAALTVVPSHPPFRGAVVRGLLHDDSRLSDRVVGQFAGTRPAFAGRYERVGRDAADFGLGCQPDCQPFVTERVDF